MSIFLPTGLGVSELSFFFLVSFGFQESNFSEFKGTAYGNELLD